MQEVLIDFAHLIAISVKISRRTCSTALYFPIYLLHTLPSPHPLLITYSIRKHTTKYVHYTGSRTPSECILANDFTNQRAQNSTPPRQRHRVGMLVGSIVSITKLPQLHPGSYASFWSVLLLTVQIGQTSTLLLNTCFGLLPTSFAQ